MIEFQVFDVDVIPVLGLKTATNLQLIQRLYTVASIGTQFTEPEILSTYADQFRSIGTLLGDYEIKIDESATPVVHPPRRNYVGWKRWVLSQRLNNLPSRSTQSLWFGSQMEMSVSALILLI